MLGKDQHVKGRFVCAEVTLDELVPKTHPIRKIDRSVDWDAVYTSVAPLYSGKGRTSVDPVVLFKMLLLEHIFKLGSLRRTVAEAEVNLAYRWFLGVPIGTHVPHFSTVSNNFTHRIRGDAFDRVFADVIEQLVKNKCFRAEEIIFASPYLHDEERLEVLRKRYGVRDPFVQMEFDLHEANDDGCGGLPEQLTI